MRKLALLVAVSLFTFTLLCSAQPDTNTATMNLSGVSAHDNGSVPSNTTSATDKAQPNDTSSGSPSGSAAVQPPAPAQTPAPITSRIGVGVKVSLLGVGIEAATPITYRTNLRVGFNAFSYGRGFTNDGINYNASLSFRSLETHFDWFPFAGAFHLSPGLMLYNGNQIKANASVGSGQSFTLGGASYISDSTNPITGTGKIGFNKVAPTFLLGWGNLLPRSQRHFSVPFEFGAVFQGAPQATLNLAGNACDSTGANCHNIATDSVFQSNVVAQQNKLNNNMSFFKVYPVISLGFGYKF